MRLLHSLIWVQRLDDWKCRSPRRRETRAAAAGDRRARVGWRGEQRPKRRGDTSGRQRSCRAPCTIHLGVRGGGFYWAKNYCVHATMSTTAGYMFCDDRGNADKQYKCAWAEQQYGGVCASEWEKYSRVPPLPCESTPTIAVKTQESRLRRGSAVGSILPLDFTQDGQRFQTMRARGGPRAAQPSPAQPSRGQNSCKHPKDV